jgi:hypothetical protein
MSGNYCTTATLEITPQHTVGQNFLLQYDRKLPTATQTVSIPTITYDTTFNRPCPTVPFNN